MVGDGTDTDHNLLLQVGIHAVLDLLGDLDQILCHSSLWNLLDQHHIIFVQGDDIVVLAVRKETLDSIYQGNVNGFDGTHQEDSTTYLGGQLQFLCSDVDITQHDVVSDNIFDKGAFIVLLLIVALDPVEGNGSHGADESCLLVFALDKDGVAKLDAPAP